MHTSCALFSDCPCEREVVLAEHAHISLSHSLTYTHPKTDLVQCQSCEQVLAILDVISYGSVWVFFFFKRHRKAPVKIKASLKLRKSVCLRSLSIYKHTCSTVIYIYIKRNPSFPCGYLNSLVNYSAVPGSYCAFTSLTEVENIIYLQCTYLFQFLWTCWREASGYLTNDTYLPWAWQKARGRWMERARLTCWQPLHRQLPTHQYPGKVPLPSAAPREAPHN